jgi:hypothetical protein
MQWVDRGILERGGRAGHRPLAAAMVRSPDSPGRQAIGLAYMMGILVLHLDWVFHWLLNERCSKVVCSAVRILRRK